MEMPATHRGAKLLGCLKHPQRSRLGEFVALVAMPCSRAWKYSGSSGFEADGRMIPSEIAAAVANALVLCANLKRPSPQSRRLI